MFNMIKYQFYRFFRSISTYITMFIVVLFNIMVVCMNAALPDAQSGEHALSSFMTSVDFAIFSFENFGISIVFSIWVVIFVYGEFHQGFMRSIVPVASGRIAFYFSHLIVSVIMFIMCSVVGSIASIVTAELTVTNISFGDITKLFPVIGAMIFVNICFSTIGMFAVYIARNAFIPLAVVFAIISGVDAVVIVWIQNTFGNPDAAWNEAFTEWTYDLCYFANISTLPLIIENNDSIMPNLIMSGAIFAVFSVLACLALVKKDIK